MFLYFEDWTDPRFFKELQEKRIPHGDRIIKVFALDEDPRIAFEKPGLTVLEIDDTPFAMDEVYEYGERGSYTGPELEAKLSEYPLEDVGKRTIRALFRFDNREGFCQAAMRARRDGEWIIHHPFGDIDGTKPAVRDLGRQNSIHLDIFFTESLRTLRGIVNFDSRDAIVGMREGLTWRIARGKEGRQIEQAVGAGKERR